MAFVFSMPEVGEGVVEAEISDWKVKIGDLVKRDQPLCEITTDKASLEISSPKTGVITALHGKPGDIIKVHAPLVEFDLDAVAAAPAAPAPVAAPAPAPVAPSVAAAPVAAPRPFSDPDLRGATKAAPAVRRHAHEVDVDVQRVPGTGPEGRVTHADVAQAASYAPAAEAPLPVAPRALPQVFSGTPAADTRVPIVGVRRKIAERMVAAKRNAPHFTYVEQLDATELVALRTKLKARAEKSGVQLSYMAFFAKACSIAFREFPNVNAWMDDEKSELVVRGEHNIGIACDTPTGLLVPVVRNVERKSILQIAAEMQDLFARTRAGKASREDLSGSTFTITSVGNIGGAFATPILNVPEVGILGVNQIRKAAVVDANDNIVVRQMTWLSPSFDHRIIDGAVAARFVARLKDILENPEQLLLELV